jgi:peptide/nickel transport system ATP-binding protein
VETADRDAFFNSPRHPYSQKLFRSLPDMTKRDRVLEVIPGSVPSLRQEFHGCRFAPRCDLSWELCTERTPDWFNGTGHVGVRCHLANPAHSDKKDKISLQDQVSSISKDIVTSSHGVLEVKDLKVHFPIHKGLFRKVTGHVHAVDGVNLTLEAGKTLALVGESGCGKTTVGKAILQLLRPVAQGAVAYDGDDLMALTGEQLRKRRSDLQIIFQDPYSSMNPRMLVGDIIEEGMLAQGIYRNAREREQRVAELLEQVGMSAEMRNRYPHEFSGGQRQRICIARALAVDPKLIVCDEPTSALDVSVQAQILNLLKDLQNKLGLSYLFITHNISVVGYLAHEVAVMYLGRIVEKGPVEQVLAKPLHPYTRALLAAVPSIDTEKKNVPVMRLEGDIPSPINPPAGCHFHPRCPEAKPECLEKYPEPVERGHMVRCYLYR